jgi:hypothetical protein
VSTWHRPPVSRSHAELSMQQIEAGLDHVRVAENGQSGTTRMPNIEAVTGSNGASPIGTVIDSDLAACSRAYCSNLAGTKPWYTRVSSTSEVNLRETPRGVNMVSASSPSPVHRKSPSPPSTLRTTGLMVK